MHGMKIEKKRHIGKGQIKRRGTNRKRIHIGKVNT